MATVSCLGPEGSFSGLAARKLCEGYDIAFCPGFAEAVRLLTEGEADFCVLPVENSLNGGVQPVLDLLAREDIFAIREYLLAVDLRLAMRKGVKKENITRVFSHEQALGQCKEYLRAQFPHAEYVCTASTSESLSLLDGHSAGIVGAHMANENITLSDGNIADVKSNHTRFLLVQRGTPTPQRSAMVFFCAVCAHKPGSLLGLLKIFQRYALNLTRIESRPVRESFGEYRFFIEFTGDITSDLVQKALSEARAYCRTFKIIGAYP